MTLSKDFFNGYVFAALIIIVGVVLLYASGVFSRDECVINGGFSCTEAQATSLQVSFLLTNMLNTALDELTVGIDGCGNNTFTNISDGQTTRITIPCTLEKSYLLNISYSKSNDTKRIYFTEGRIKFT
ncbi:MAG: hypothetical protein V1725_03915 [archaeon]